MASIPTELTVADISEQFGPISLARIRTTPKPGSATEQDAIDIEAREDLLFELYDGVLVLKVMGFYESYLASLLQHFLNGFVLEHDLGIVAGAGGTLELFPGEVRIPDVSFISWELPPGRKIPREPIPVPLFDKCLPRRLCSGTLASCDSTIDRTLRERGLLHGSVLATTFSKHPCHDSSLRSEYCIGTSHRNRCGNGFTSEQRQSWTRDES